MSQAARNRLSQASAKTLQPYEQGDKELDGAAFYVPMCELSDPTGLLAEALLKRGSPLPLLPAGEARIEKTTTLTVRSSAGVERALVGYAITGLDLYETVGVRPR